MDFDGTNIKDLNDMEIVSCMRETNYEKFKTLVRMHLSFELDLNTDEFDLPCHEIVYEDKGKIKKWNRLSKKHKQCSMNGVAAGCAATIKSAGNSPIEDLHHQIDAGFLFHLKELKDFLMSEKSLLEEGIFRKTGSVSRQNELRSKMHQNDCLALEASGYSTHDCATVFKSYLAELPEPLLTDAHYPAHLQIAPLCIGMTFNIGANTSTTRPPNPDRLKREQRLLNSMQLLILLLPEENRQLLRHVVDLLHAVADKEYSNKMSADNLATLFSPHLICPRNLPPEALYYLSKQMASIIAYMIIRGSDIFDIPAKLSTDIRAYFMERKRRKTMSPEQTLDDSISDISTVNTVYTFVDREKTAAAHNTNTTDTELAQLYAYIQSLPDSSRKRRLIKQFNKQNGQGTPLQLVVMNRLKNMEATRSAKSFGDSIKRHIFNKGIMTRTPKRSNGPVPIGIETPNFSNAKQPKLRVLFQSPSNTPIKNTRISSPSLLSCASNDSVPPSPKPSMNTSHVLKNHPLQKSISSTSLLMNSSKLSRNSHQHCDEIPIQSSIPPSSYSSSSVSSPPSSHESLSHHRHILNSEIQTGCSTSVAPTAVAPAASCHHKTPINLIHSSCSSSVSSPPIMSSAVSEITGQQSIGMNSDCIDAGCCSAPLKLISEATKTLIGIRSGSGTGGGGGGGGGCSSNRDESDNHNDKKTVIWNDHQQLLISDDDDGNEQDENFDYTNTNNINENDLKSRYKSEPNLSRILKGKSSIGDTLKSESTSPTRTSNANIGTPTVAGGGNGGGGGGGGLTKSLTRKLMKGVSMDNLTFQFRSPESTKRIVRSVSSALKRRHSDETRTDLLGCLESATENSAFSIKEIARESDDDELDDNELDEDAKSDPESYRESAFSSYNQEEQELAALSEMPANCSMTYNNTMHLITSTPSLWIGRRSMSPITKSTQRMPKAMQESIMTPRSRKPVMVMATTGSSDQNQTICQTMEFPSFQDSSTGECVDTMENSKSIDCPHEREFPAVFSEDANQASCSYSEIVRQKAAAAASSQFPEDYVDAECIDSKEKLGLEFFGKASNSNSNTNDPSNAVDTLGQENITDEALTTNFKEYLLTRSVLTAIPEDSSFCSRPDDFIGDDDDDDDDDDDVDGNNDESFSDEIENLNESHLSPSLLYCLDGNQPEDGNNPLKESNKDDLSSSSSAHEVYVEQEEHIISDAQNNARKRAAKENLSSTSSTSKFAENSGEPINSIDNHLMDNKENIKNSNDVVVFSKKLLISDYPNETSL